MKKKYQIFVSSTFEDLKEERNLVIKAILEMGHIPVGMEMFSAGDEQQWKLIQTQIDDCDYYIVISAFRYGSLDGDTGYTEKEYDYALKVGIPVLGFVINEGVSWPASKIDKNASKVKKLKAFKSKIKGRLISYWEDKNDLYGKVSIALMKQFNTSPGIGWIKSNESTSPDVLNEISRLSTENSELRGQLIEFKKKEDKKKEDEFQSILKTLKKNKKKLQFVYVPDNGWENESSFTLFEIFNILAPEMLIEKSTNDCSYSLGLHLNPDKNKKVRKIWPTPSNYIKQVLADLNALEIISPSLKKHPISDKLDYWTLTELGTRLLKVVRQETLFKNLDEKDSKPIDEIKTKANKT